MTRKVFAATFVLAIFLVATVAGRLLTSPLPTATRGQTIAMGSAESARPGDAGHIKALAIPTAHVSAQARVPKHRVVAVRMLADAFRSAERTQKRLEIARYAAREHEALAFGPDHIEIESEIDRQVADALARKHRQDEQGLIADARSKAQGVQLDQQAQGPSSDPTGAIGCKKCGKSAAPPRAKTRRGVKVARVAQARAVRVRPARTTGTDCPMLAWLHTRL